MVLGLYMNVCGLYCENPWYYRVCEDYNGVVSKVLGDGWINPRILSVQSLEAHQHMYLHLGDALALLASAQYEDMPSKHASCTPVNRMLTPSEWTH